MAYWLVVLALWLTAGSAVCVYVFQRGNAIWNVAGVAVLWGAVTMSLSFILLAAAQSDNILGWRWWLLGALTAVGIEIWLGVFILARRVRALTSNPSSNGWPDINGRR